MHVFVERIMGNVLWRLIGHVWLAALCFHDAFFGLQPSWQNVLCCHLNALGLAPFCQGALLAFYSHLLICLCLPGLKINELQTVQNLPG